jgi:hypothetical protein
LAKKRRNLLGKNLFCSDLSLDGKAQLGEKKKSFFFFYWICMNQVANVNDVSWPLVTLGVPLWVSTCPWVFCR